MNILVLSAGTRNKIIQYFKKELKGEGKVIATDCSNLAPAIYEADKFYITSRIDEEGYLTYKDNVREWVRFGDLSKPVTKENPVFFINNVPKYYLEFLDNGEEDDKKIDEYTYRRNVSIQDMRIYSIISSIKECLSYQEEDSLADITNKLYYLADKQIHPYHRKNLDLEDVRFYVELEYINKEQQKENESKHNIKYDDSEV